MMLVDDEVGDETSKSISGSYDGLGFFFFQFHGPNTEKKAGPAPCHPYRPAQEEKDINDIFLFQGLTQNNVNKRPSPAATL